MASVIPRKKVLIPRHSVVYRRVNSEARNFGTEEKGLKKISFTKNPAPAYRMDSMFLSETCFVTEFLEFASIFFPRIRIPNIFLLYRTAWNGSLRVSVPRNDSEWNSKSLLLILFHGTEFRAFFSAEWFETEFREFSVPRNSRNSAGTIQLFRLFCLPRNNFFVKNCQP
jgi:hypothetical protein